MASNLISFTEKNLNALSIPAKGRKRYYDKKLPQLGITVTDKGSKSFHVVATLDGMTKRPAIEHGKYPNMHPDQARRIARDMIADISKNGDPVKARRDKAAHDKASQVTYRDVLDDFLEANKHKHKESTQKNHTRFAESSEDFGEYLDRPLSDITFDIVLEVNTRRGQKSIQAMKTLKTIFNFALNTYFLNGKPVFTENPVARLWALKLNNKYVKRTKILKAEQFPAWFAALDKLEDPRDKEYMLFLLFTGCRGGESYENMTWDHIDWDKHTYTFHDTKNRTDVFMAPLPDYIEQMLLLRKEDTGEDGQIFPQVGKDGQNIINDLEELTGFRITRHDLRRTFTTCAAACEIPDIILKQFLNHKSDNSTGVTDDYKQMHEVAGFRIDKSDPVRSASQQIESALLRVAGKYKDNIVSLVN